MHQSTFTPHQHCIPHYCACSPGPSLPFPSFPLQLWGRANCRRTVTNLTEALARPRNPVLLSRWSAIGRHHPTPWPSWFSSKDEKQRWKLQEHYDYELPQMDSHVVALDVKAGFVRLAGEAVALGFLRRSSSILRALFALDRDSVTQADLLPIGVRDGHGRPEL